MGQNTRLILFVKKKRKKVRLVVIGAINLSSYLKYCLSKNSRSKNKKQHLIYFYFQFD